MANSNEQETNTTNTFEIEQPVQIQEEPTPPSHSSPMKFITPVIAFAALFIAGYNYYATHQATEHLATANKQLTTDLNRFKQQQTGLEQQIKEKEDTIQQANQALEQQLNEFSNQVHALSMQKGNQNQDWLLLKVRYYLELAQINAHWSSLKDGSTATLLQQADTLLAQMNTPELFKIRQIIAREILQLKTNNTIDVPGLLSQLDAVQTNITQLSIQAPSFEPTAPQAQDNSSGSNSPWKASLKNSLNSLKSLVIIRHNDEDIKPLLSPLYEAILKESMRLNIQEAQWAIINNNPEAYQLALNQALTTLKRGFSIQQTNISAVMKQLIGLQKINLTSEKPEVGQALPLLNQLIEQRKLSDSTKVTNNKGEEEL